MRRSGAPTERLCWAWTLSFGQRPHIFRDGLAPTVVIAGAPIWEKARARLRLRRISMSDQRGFVSADEFHPDPYTQSRTAERTLNSAILHASPSCNGRGRRCVDIHSRKGDSWRCYRRDPFCVDTGVGRSVRQNLHCELAHIAEMERIACSAGASLRPPAKR